MKAILIDDCCDADRLCLGEASMSVSGPDAVPALDLGIRPSSMSKAAAGVA